MMRFLFSMIFICLLGGYASAVETIGITAPITITVPGNYTLMNDIAGDIRIEADNVNIYAQGESCEEIYLHYGNGGCQNIYIDGITCDYFRVWNSKDVGITNSNIGGFSINGVNTGTKESRNVYIGQSNIQAYNGMTGAWCVIGNSVAAAKNFLMEDCVLNAHALGGYAIQVAAPSTANKTDFIIRNCTMNLTEPTNNYGQVQYANGFVDNFDIFVDSPKSTGRRVSLRSQSIGTWQNSKLYVTDAGNNHGFFIVGSSSWTLNNNDIRILGGGGSYVIYQNESADLIANRNILVGDGLNVLKHYNGQLSMVENIIYGGPNNGPVVDLHYSGKGENLSFVNNLIVSENSLLVNNPSGPLTMQGNHYWAMDGGALVVSNGNTYTNANITSLDINATTGMINVEMGADTTSRFTGWPPDHGEEPLTGACCLENNTCVMLTAQGCALNGGEYLGDSQLCLVSICDPLEPFPTGACCLVDNSCTTLTQSECEVTLTSTYLGDGVPCDPDPCNGSVTPPSPPGGATDLEARVDSLVVINAVIAARMDSLGVVVETQQTNIGEIYQLINNIKDFWANH